MDDAYDDAYLLARAQAGYLDAFEALVERYQVRVYRVALRMLGNQADAQDATQDALVSAWQGLASFRGDSAFATWLYRIITNRCLNLLRDRPRTEPLAVELEARTGRPDELVEAGQQRAALLGSIGGLRPEQRAPLVLREFEGCSYEEIAGILGISVAAVKGRLHRARLELLDVMHPWT
jgi:RNA polymerase sigma-70 factor (ECF subfamily)